MGSKYTLIEFIQWSIANYPAEKYCLILDDHGRGWRGVCTDYTSNDDILTLSEIKEAIESVNFHLDVLFFSACTMGMIEVFYQFKGLVDFTIGSETVQKSVDNLWRYYNIFEFLIENPLATPDQLAQKIIENADGHSCVKTSEESKLIDLSNSIDTLIASLTDLAKLKRTEILDEADDCSGGFGLCPELYAKYEPFAHDLYKFAESIYHQTEDGKYSEINQAAAEVMNIIDSLEIYLNNNIEEGLHGISICFPSMKPDDRKDKFSLSEYKDIIFAQETNWDEFLEENVKSKPVVKFLQDKVEHMPIFNILLRILEKIK